MITELFTYMSSLLRASITPEARAFGHLYESISLIQREKRCARYWLPHRTLCKEFIQENVQVSTGKSAVLILGSGPLHEIPVEFLAKNFKRVDMVDVVHLPEVQKQWAHLQNIRFITADVTDLEAEILRTKRPVEKIPELFLKDQYDLVISANLMSQLAYHLRQFLEKKAQPLLDENALDAFANKVTENHFHYLKQFTCPVILITDIETHLLDKKDQLVEKTSPYVNFNFPTPTTTWWWNVAPIPEYSRELAVKMKVAAFILNSPSL